MGFQLLVYGCTCLHLWSRFDYEMEEHHHSAQRGSKLGYLIQRAREPGFGFVYVGKDLHRSSGRRECECSDIADGLGNPFVSQGQPPRILRGRIAVCFHGHANCLLRNFSYRGCRRDCVRRSTPSKCSIAKSRHSLSVASDRSVNVNVIPPSSRRTTVKPTPGLGSS